MSPDTDLLTLAAIADDPNLAVIIHDPEGRILRWNRGAELMYGYDGGQARGMNMAELIPPELQSDYRRFIARQVREQPERPRDRTLETGRITRGGGRLEIWLTATPVTAPDGNILGVAVAERDITQIKRDEFKLNSYLDSSPDAVVIIDKSGGIVRANGQAERLTGYDREELLAGGYEKLVPEAVQAAHKINHRHFFDNASSREMGSGLELHIRHKSGREIPVQISLTPVTVAGETTVLVRIRDITGEIAILDSLAEAKYEAERSDRAKTRFLAAASHDLRQPLHAINMYLGVLDVQKRREQRRQTTNKIRTSIDSINQLLNGLLDISKLEGGAVVPQIRNFPVGRVLGRVYNSATSAALENSQEFVMVPSSLRVRCDENLLERLLANVASNAIRYAGEGGHVVLGCRRRGDRVEIQVLDNGIGIPADHIDKIFDEYYRVSGSDRGVQGVGLGLAIVRQIAQLLGLEANVASEPGRGTLFSTFVPAAKQGGRWRATAEETSPAALFPIEGATVLMLEDNAAVLDSTRMLLESHGLNVLSALTVSQAYDYLGEGAAAAPDLLICDYSLGEGDNGLEVIKGIRAMVRRSIPAILMSGHTSSQLTHEAGMANCQLAHKPVDPGKMIRTIEELLHQSGYGEEEGG